MLWRCCKCTARNIIAREFCTNCQHEYCDRQCYMVRDEFSRSTPPTKSKSARKRSPRTTSHNFDHKLEMEWF